MFVIFDKVFVKVCKESVQVSKVYLHETDTIISENKRKVILTVDNSTTKYL